MDIIVFLVAAAAVGGFIYYRLNKDKADGSHPLDSVMPKIEPQPVSTVVETKPVEAVNAIAEPAKCGCGRSPTGLCVGLHKLSTEEWSVHADNPNKVVQIEQPKIEPVDTKPAVKKGKKTVTARVKNTKAVEKAPAKKGRKPKVKEPARKPVARKLKNA